MAPGGCLGRSARSRALLLRRKDCSTLMSLCAICGAAGGALFRKPEAQDVGRVGSWSCPPPYGGSSAHVS